MTFLAGLLVVVFLVLTIAVIARISKLAKRLDSDEESQAGGAVSLTSNKINAVLMPIFFIVGIISAWWSYLDAKKYFLPEAASEHGIKTDSMFAISMLLCLVAFFLTNAFLFYFAWKYQYKPGRKATFYPVNHRLEYIWTAAPAVMMAIMVFFGWKLWTDITKEAPENSYVVEIMGKQFGWQVRYPGIDDNKLGRYNYKLIDEYNEFGVDVADENSFDDITGTEMHVPKGKPVLLKIRARDVLHSVFIPHMRVKMDAVPGMPTKFWFIPTKTTEEMRYELGNPDFNYEIACTEICGQGHFGMKMTLVVEESEAACKKWLATQKPWFTNTIASNPDYLKRVPENLKAKAMKYVEGVAPTDSTTAGVQPTGVVGGNAALR